MIIHVTVGGVLEVIGGATVVVIIYRLLCAAWMLWRWGK